ncbi:MAG: hypothetical protein J5531_04810 [Lachnospiraceae bacterium]|nr:hypothetical protein [Lachnospiraceae bacterium]
MNRKRICSVLLMLVLTLTMLAGCGDKDESKKKKEKTPAVVKGSVEEMLDAMAATESGTARLELSAGKQTAAFDFSFDRKSRDLTVAVKATVKGKEIQNDFYVMKDNAMYVNLEAILDVVAAMDASDEIPAEVKNLFKGWLAFPLPKDLPDEFFAVKASAFTNLVAKLVKGLTAEGSDGDYTVSAKTKDDYRKLLEIAQDYTDNELKKDLTSGSDRLAALQKVDLNAYVQELIDFYKDDVYALVRQYGDRMDITEDQLTGLLSEVKNQDFNTMFKEYLEQSAITGKDTQKLLGEIVDDISKILADSKEDLEKTEAFPEAVVRVSADDKGYTTEFTVKSLDNAMEGASDVIGGDVKITFRLVPGTADVSKPSDIASVKTIADMLVPSYTRYVEKSRVASDAEYLQEVLRCAEVLTADPEFSVLEGTQFIIDIDNGEVSVSVKDADGVDRPEVAKEWDYICEISDRSFKCMELEMAKGTLVGVVKEFGQVSWKKEKADSALETFFSTTGSFARFFE